MTEKKTVTRDDIADAINRLNPEDDAHWTQAGKPNLNVLREYLGVAVMRADTEGLPDREGVRALAKELDSAGSVDPSPAPPEEKSAAVIAPPAAPNPMAVEVSCYRGAIEALNNFGRAMNGIPVGRRDPELRRLLDDWQSCRDAVQERFNRVIERAG